MTKLTTADKRRRTIDEAVEYLSEGDFSLDELVARHGPGLTIRWETGYYDDPDSLSIRRIREETDEELEARLEALREANRQEERRKRDARKAREDGERATYERLKKKFEG